MLDHRRLANGQPAPDFPVDQYKQIDEKFGRTCPEFRVVRCEPPAPGLVAHEIRDRSGRIRGMLALELDAMELDDPQWLLSRAQRVVDSTPRPDLKIVG